MALVFKSKVKNVLSADGEISLQTDTNSNIAEIVDNLGSLASKIETIQKKQLEPLLTLQKQLMSDLTTFIDKVAGPTEKGGVAGQNYVVEYGKKADKTTVILETDKLIAMLEQIEPGLFEKLAKIGITDLKAYLTPKQLEKVVKVEPVGARKISFKSITLVG